MTVAENLPDYVYDEKHDEDGDGESEYGESENGESEDGGPQQTVQLLGNTKGGSQEPERASGVRTVRLLIT